MQGGFSRVAPALARLIQCSSVPDVPPWRANAASALPHPSADGVGSDQALAQALIGGHPDAPTVAWNRFSGMVYGTLERAVGDNDVDDLAQEVFLRLFRRIHTLQDPTALRSFVYSICVRVVHGELRRRWVRRIMRLAPTSELPEAPVAHADHEGREAVRRLYQLLDRLTPRDRLIYGLRAFEQLTVGEVAAAVGASEATVKRRSAHAGARMAAWIARDPVLQPYADSPPVVGTGREGNDLEA